MQGCVCAHRSRLQLARVVEEVEAMSDTQGSLEKVAKDVHRDNSSMAKQVVKLEQVRVHAMRARSHCTHIQALTQIESHSADERRELQQTIDELKVRRRVRVCARSHALACAQTQLGITSNKFSKGVKSAMEEAAELRAQVKKLTSELADSKQALAASEAGACDVCAICMHIARCDARTQRAPTARSHCATRARD
jgi:hypothetical protein